MVNKLNTEVEKFLKGGALGQRAKEGGFPSGSVNLLFDFYKSVVYSGQSISNKTALFNTLMAMATSWLH